MTRVWQLHLSLPTDNCYLFSTVPPFSPTLRTLFFSRSEVITCQMFDKPLELFCCRLASACFCLTLSLAFLMSFSPTHSTLSISLHLSLSVLCLYSLKCVPRFIAPIKTLSWGSTPASTCGPIN